MRAASRCTCLLLLALVAALPARAERRAFRTFTSAQGLASDGVRALLEDSHGFLWVGTTAGLSRFDGHEFRNYEVADGLPSPRIDGLFESRRGELFVMTEEGAARLDPHPAAMGQACTGAPASAAAM